MAITQVITPLPPAPQRTDPPAVFVPKADAHVASLDQLVTEENLFGEQVNETQVEINNTAILVGVLASNAADSEAAAAANANFKGRWSDATGAATVPSAYSHTGKTWQLLQNIPDITVDEPTDIAPNWQAITPDPQTAVNTTAISTVLPHTVSGLLTAGGRVNQIRDSGAFTMPLAGSVAADVVLVVELPDVFGDQTPTLGRTGGDLFRNIGGTDTDIVWVGAAKLTFTSNGVDEWSL